MGSNPTPSAKGRRRTLGCVNEFGVLAFLGVGSLVAAADQLIKGFGRLELPDRSFVEVDLLNERLI